MNIKSLKEAYLKYFKIGAAVGTESLKACKSKFKTHFNSITCENAMKSGKIHPKPQEWNFEPADKIANFGRENKIPVRGHTLLWHQQMPDWFMYENENYASREVIYNRLEEHIKTLTSRYKDIIWCWDVVNEAVTDNNQPITDKSDYPIADILRKGVWREAFGPDYVEKAFILANEYAPDKTLVYNDYNTCLPHKRERIIKLI